MYVVISSRSLSSIEKSVWWASKCSNRGNDFSMTNPFFAPNVSRVKMVDTIMFGSIFEPADHDLFEGCVGFEGGEET